MADFDGDGRTDLMARRSDGTCTSTPATGEGGSSPGPGGSAPAGRASTPSSAPGDFTGDGIPEVIGRRNDGSADHHPGNGVGGWLPRTLIASDWAQYTALTSIGDFTGDRRSDVLGRTSDGRFWVIPGNGSGGVSTRKLVGSGWQTFSRILL